MIIIVSSNKFNLEYFILVIHSDGKVYTTIPASDRHFFLTEEDAWNFRNDFLQ